MLKELADTGFPTFVSSPTSFNEETGFHTFCFTATGGTDLIGIGVVDVSDTIVDSGVLVDNFRTLADGDADGAGDPCDNCPVDPNPGQHRFGVNRIRPFGIHHRDSRRQLRPQAVMICDNHVQANFPGVHHLCHRAYTTIYADDQPGSLFF